MRKLSRPVPVLTEDGSQTLFVKSLNEHYHSMKGALTESQHVFIESGFKSIHKPELSILEMGFGTGLNCLLTAQAARKYMTRVQYTAIEKYPLKSDIVNKLNYSELITGIEPGFLSHIHTLPWESAHYIQDNFRLTKLAGDLLKLEIPGNFDLVYYDAFAPDVQPELWSPEVFIKLYLKMNTPALLTTYSSKGQIRRNMIMAGFRVEKTPGPPGKWEMTRAWKD